MYKEAEMFILLAKSPFFQAYVTSDFFGKIIFIMLFLLSALSWGILLHKIWVTHTIRKASKNFRRLFESKKKYPLSLELSKDPGSIETPNAFEDLYGVLKKTSLEMLSKNRWYHEGLPAAPEKEERTYLSSTDLTLLESYLMITISTLTQQLEKNLFILSTSVSLAPFLGLLGTVWGILITFSEMQTGGGTSSNNEVVLGGLSMALATTVLGLLVAIPALVGYNYLRSLIRDFGIEMENFSSEMLAAVEMQYRKVDVK